MWCLRQLVWVNATKYITLLGSPCTTTYTCARSVREALQTFRKNWDLGGRDEQNKTFLGQHFNRSHEYIRTWRK